MTSFTIPQQLHYVRPAIQTYAWGCKGGGLVATSAAVNGLPVDSSKEYAEAWFGTHTSAPSLLIDGEKATPLHASLELPLLKILAIRAPLSIQLHPDSGIAPFLNRQFPSIYKDPCAKPEMVIPITPLLVLMGVKQYENFRNSVAAVPAVAEFIGNMESTSNVDIRETEIIRVLSKWLSLSSEQAKPLVQKVLDQLPTIESATIPKDVIEHLNKSFPLDVGVLAPIFLNVLRLAPGQALFVPPNVLHAYIDGDAVEIMNCSDNVIRAGLTPKLRDADLLCKLLYADECGSAANPGQPTGAFTRVYRPADRVRDFELSAVDLPANQKTTLEALPVTSLLLCTTGSGNISSSLNALNIETGQCILCPPGVSVDISTSDKNVSVYRASRNQGPAPDDAEIHNIAKIIFEELPKLTGEESAKKALEAAELLRPLEQYISDVWFRAAAYHAIGSTLSKSGNDDAIAYAAARWLQKAIHVCNLAGDATTDTPIAIPQTGGSITPSTIKEDASARLATVLSQITK